MKSVLIFVGTILAMMTPMFLYLWGNSGRLGYAVKFCAKYIAGMAAFIVVCGALGALLSFLYWLSMA